MNLNRRLIGLLAVRSAEGDVIDVDLESLVRRLILFDTHVVYSIRLKEFPILARRLGYERLRDLLSSGLIEIRCECLQLTQTAQSGLFGDPILPRFHYQFHWIDTNKAKYVHDCLQPMHDVPNIRHKDIVRLKRLIIENIKPLPTEIRPQLFPPFQQELLHNPELVKKSTELVLLNRLGRKAQTFLLKIHQESETTFRAETDVRECFGLDEAEAHAAVEAGLLGLAHLTQSIGEMKAYSALNGFRDEDLPLFRQKLDFLADAVSSRPSETKFHKIVELIGVPTLPDGSGSINVDQLLKVRVSREASEFRDLLGRAGTASEKELAESLAGVRSIIGLKLSTPTAKAIRFLTTSALGFVPHGALPAIALGAFDQFILEKIFPYSGPAAFINELYPSIFETGKDSQSRGAKA